MSVHSDSSEEAGLARMPAGTHVAWRNDYFVLIDNRNYQDCVLRIHDKWASDEYLGTQLKAKCLRPNRFQEPRAAPEVTYLVLKAWMLWRMEWRDCKFLKGCAARLETWLREARALRHQVGRRHGDLHEAARRQIEEFVPSISSPSLELWPRGLPRP